MSNAHETMRSVGRWLPAVPPDIEAGVLTGRLQACSWCGSMEPAEVAAAIRAGASISFADWKYGWPHKAYLEGVPNPHAGMLESRCSQSRQPPDEELAAGKWLKVPTGRFDEHTGDRRFTWAERGRPAAATTWGKFYSEHLQDASPEDRVTIERALGLAFTFEKGGVSWRPFTEPAAAEGGPA